MLSLFSTSSEFPYSAPWVLLDLLGFNNVTDVDTDDVIADKTDVLQSKLDRGIKVKK